MARSRLVQTFQSISITRVYAPSAHYIKKKTKNKRATVVCVYVRNILIYIGVSPKKKINKRIFFSFSRIYSCRDGCCCCLEVVCIYTPLYTSRTRYTRNGRRSSRGKEREGEGQEEGRKMEVSTTGAEDA